MKIASIVIMTFLGLLFGGCRPYPIAEDPEVRTKMQLSAWRQVFRMFHHLHRHKAKSLEEVSMVVRDAFSDTASEDTKATSALNEFLHDGWGAEYTFRYLYFDENYAEIEIRSSGRDRTLNTSDDFRAIIRVDFVEKQAIGGKGANHGCPVKRFPG